MSSPKSPLEQIGKESVVEECSYAERDDVEFSFIPRTSTSFRIVMDF